MDEIEDNGSELCKDFHNETLHISELVNSHQYVYWKRIGVEAAVAFS